MEDRNVEEERKRKYVITAIYTLDKYIGVVEAGDEEEAEEAGYNMVANEEIILCHYCSKKINRPTFYSLVVEEEEDEAKEGGGIGKSPVV